MDSQRVAELTRAGDVGLGGADLAATFARLDLIDSYRIYVHPVLIGSGTPLFRSGGPQHALRLVGTRTFGNGVVGMHHDRVRE